MGRLSARAAAMALSVFLAASASAADPVHWNGAGWYGIGDDEFGAWIAIGPLSDEATCRAGQPPNTEDAIYSCEYLAAKPAWDE